MQPFTLISSQIEIVSSLMTQTVSHKNGMEMNYINIEYYFLKMYILTVYPHLESPNDRLCFCKSYLLHLYVKERNTLVSLLGGYKSRKQLDVFCEGQNNPQVLYSLLLKT